MKVGRIPLILATLLLVAMGLLMIGPVHQDSATVDETSFLSAGYSYMAGYRFYFDPESPPLSQLLVAMPLSSMDVRLSPTARSLVDRSAGYPWTVPWFGEPQAIQGLFPQGRDNWYFWPKPEAQIFGQMLVYGGDNDGDAMISRARFVQVFVTLAVGVLIFFWVRRAVANELAALLALALWVFNPSALAYGHLIITDIDGTLGIGAAILLFALYLEKPANWRAALCGAAVGAALTMKFNAVTLGPIFAIMAAVSWRTMKTEGKSLWKHGLFLAGAAWLVILLAYAPMWAPAPPISSQQAEALGVPGWFTGFRLFLIPRDFFKGVALVMSHSKIGHEAYLMGEWSRTGWRTYFPIAFFVKSPLAFVLATLTGAAWAVARWKSLPLLVKAPWIATAVYLGMAIASNVNIGVRHLLPIFPLLCVGVGCLYAQFQKIWAKRALFALAAWQAVIAVAGYPLYVQFMSEAIGGSKNGYKYLIDSNYDWGQDAKRLKAFLDERHIDHIYLDYFGTQYSIEYLKISNTRIDAEKARQIVQGWLVVSASQLMRPEWNWLRETRPPTARVADTLFVYNFNGQTAPAQ